MITSADVSDLCERLDHAAQSLTDLTADCADEFCVECIRRRGKAEGVLLALSYAEELFR